MVTKQRCQTTAPLGLGMLSLPVLAGVLSPYFQRKSMRRVGNTGRIILILNDMKIIITGYRNDTGGNLFADILIANGGTGLDSIPVTYSGINSNTDLEAAGLAAVLDVATTRSYGITAADVSHDYTSVLGLLSPTPSSYQTIVSQTGTAVPAVAGGLAPTSTYASGTTFTWARSSAGVYTLTASTAVFNTSGKTSVFVTPLQNLNAQVRGVVTSSTVITFTTAIGSLLGLGLLGLTATNTDALLNGTMIDVRTYA